MKRISRRSALKAAAAAGAAPWLASCADETAPPAPPPRRPESTGFHNPYDGAAGPWLRGEIHAHVDRSGESAHRFADGVPPAQVYRGAREAGLDFVCMSVDVERETGGVRCFGDVLSGRQDGVIGIPAREIQNNYFTGYFSEPGSSYLHVMTLGGPDGISLCAHPLYYEIANPHKGGSWTELRKALLNPSPGGNLDRLRISGLEVYNGYTRRRLKERRQERRYEPTFEEACWDDMLVAGRRYWGYAGNDLFYRPEDVPAVFSPLGTVHVSGAAGRDGAGILAGLREGRFYSGTGVELADAPLEARAEGDLLRIRVASRTPVKWKAVVHGKTEAGWALRTLERPAGASAEFEISGEWRYVRVQCESEADPLRRAWLQPLTRPAYFT